MNIGLLWCDDTGKKPLAENVADAAKRHFERFGVRPDTCYVHLTELPDGDRVVGGVAVKSSARVLRHHFWVGVENEKVPVDDAHPAGQSQPTGFNLTEPAMAAAA